MPSSSLSPYLFTDDLQLVCTDDCTVGLESYRQGVVSACQDFMTTDSINNSYAPTLAVDFVSGPYMVQCLQDPSTGDYCGPLLQSYNSTDGLLSFPTNELCTYCTLETLNVTVSNPTSYSLELANLLSNAVGICGAFVPPNLNCLDSSSYLINSPLDSMKVITPHTTLEIKSSYPLRLASIPALIPPSTVLSTDGTSQPAPPQLVPMSAHNTM